MEKASIDPTTGFPVKPEDQKMWYTTFCNSSEVDRIMKPQNGDDLILQRRADIIADHVRFTRLYCKKAHQPNWSLEQSFSKEHYKNFLKYLKDEDKERCNDVSFGDIFSDNLNAYAENNEYFGTIIYLNESLRYFLYYMILSTFPFEYPVPESVRIRALIIAIRIYLGKEAMDFEMDPRGKVPKELDSAINYFVEDIMQYIVGHEFSHYLCNHLNNSSNRTFFSSLGDKKFQTEIFNIDQKQELEADLKSLTIPVYPSEVYERQYVSSICWFAFLEIAEFASENINPSNRSYQTHPTANDRIVNIRDNAPQPEKFSESSEALIELLITHIDPLKDFLQYNISTNIEMYEVYGSMYLAEPNTEWRGRELIDRVDY